MTKIVFGVILLVLLLTALGPSGFPTPEEVMGKVGLIFLIALGIGFIVWGIASKVSEIRERVG